MKPKTVRLLFFLITAVLLVLGCKNAFHEPEYNPSDPIVSDGKSYTVTFNRNGGSGTVPDPIKWESGGSINLPYQGGLSRTNYTFSGWNTNASGAGTTFAAGASFTVPNQDVTLYAKWDVGDVEGTTPSNPSEPTAPYAPSTPPATPTGVDVEPLSSTSIRVTWNPVADATSYNVYCEQREPPNYYSSEIQLVGNVKSPSFVHNNLSNNNAYYYWITAINNAGESNFPLVGAGLHRW